MNVLKVETANNENSQDNRRQGGNFGYLFIGLLMTLLAIPLSNLVPGIGRYSMTLLFTLFMLVAVWSLSASRHIFYLGAMLALAIFTISGISIFGGPGQTLDTAGLLLFLIFNSLSSWIAARNVFVLHRVDLNSLIGAFCVYLLLGLIWATLYRLLHLWGWATFTGTLADQGPQVFSDLVYFSFVTLASLGYGDIAPVGGLVRTLAFLEAVIGQFYLAVLVASLVSAFTTQRRQDRNAS